MERGRIIKINYVERLKSTGRITDTNVESVAREAGIHDPEESSRYRPLPTIVGSGRPVKGVDEALHSLIVGEGIDLQVPPEKGYGARDPKLVDQVSASYFRRQRINPVRGLPIRTRRGIAIVRSTTGGRVWLDYNHPLAGQTLQYRVEVVDEAKDPESKIRWLAEMHLPGIDPEAHVVEIQGSKAVVELNYGELPVPAIKDLNTLLREEVSNYVPEVTDLVFGTEQPSETVEPPKTETESKADEGAKPDSPETPGAPERRRTTPGKTP